ncbi:MAG: hypothetical protein M1825_005946 [Sarcosagium campestre]|nr:MAG: hypothetical protein M1825_005946 [Sarcosagium campestre]
MTLIPAIRNVTADGVDVFYREAGPADAPVILLLHGFPSSSHQYRNLIPLLAATYHVIAPDLPGFGFTKVPSTRGYKYTFANLATTVGAFLDALHISKFAVYIFDYGAPTALRLALQRPEAITALIAQNGNAYDEGLGKEFWAPFQKYWKSNASEDREAIRTGVLSYAATKLQYEHGVAHPEALAPEAWTLDYALISTPENQEIQLDIFFDYGTNVVLYPKFQEYFRKYQPPTLAVWGKNDFIFPPTGAEALKKDLKDVEITLYDTGHFALETNVVDISGKILDFLKRRGI